MLPIARCAIKLRGSTAQQAPAVAFSSRTRASLRATDRPGGASLGLALHLPSPSFAGGHPGRMFAVGAKPGDETLSTAQTPVADRTEILFKTKLYKDEADKQRTRYPERQEEPDIKLGHSPGLHLSNEFMNIAHGSDVMSTERFVQVLIDYPLETPVTVTLKADWEEGITRDAFGRGVQQAYSRLYDEEDVAQGRHGIYDHCLSDLYLMAAHRAAGATVWQLIVDVREHVDEDEDENEDS